MNLTPGEYRTYLAPRAMEELVQLMSWYGAFGRRPTRRARRRCCG